MGLSTVDAFKHLVSSDAMEITQPDLRRLQLVLVEIVADVDRVCRENGLSYALGGGTALGARRHKGFIPWDDDVDLNIPRADYNRFIPLFRARFGHKYWIHTPAETSGYGLALARIRLKGSCVRTREDLANVQMECGAFVDIFIVESVPSCRVLRCAHGMVSLALGLLYSCRKFYFERRLVRRWSMENAGMSLAFRIKCAIGFFTAFASLDFWTRLWDWWNRLCSGGDSEYVTIPVGRRHYFGELARREDLCETVDVEWEGTLRKAPKDLDGYMTRLYGPNYMTPPPPEKRERHVVFRPFFLNREDSELAMVVATHKQYAMPQDAVYLPVFVGAALSGDAAVPPGFARDDEGENISAKNRGWCELTALYWAWKNTKADAVGLVHYRRHFRGRGGIASGAEICEALSRADAVLPKRRNYFIESTYSQYIHAHHAEDLDETRRILEERHPDFLPAFDSAMKSTSGHRFNMMVMKRPLLDDYCTWLFGVLSELERRLDISSYSDYDRRVFGFVAERLLDVYIVARSVNYVEMPVLHLESQHWPRKIASFLNRKYKKGR